MPYRCRICARPFTHFDTYQFHLKIHDESSNMQCHDYTQIFEFPKDDSRPKQLKKANVSNQQTIFKSLQHDAISYENNEIFQNGNKNITNQKVANEMVTIANSKIFSKELGTEEKQCLQTSSIRSKIICRYCSRIFENMSHLKIHLNQSTNCSLRPLFCKFCEQTFESVPAMKSHEELHSQIADASSNSKFTHLTRMNGTIFKQTYNKPYKCMHCHKTFSIYSCFIKHTEKHQVPQMHQCYYCAKCFKKSSELVEHYKTHDFQKKKRGRPVVEDHHHVAKRKSCMQVKDADSDRYENYQCYLCAQILSSSRALVDHYNSHKSTSQKQHLSGLKTKLDNELPKKQNCQMLMSQMPSLKNKYTQPLEVSFFDVVCQTETSSVAASPSAGDTINEQSVDGVNLEINRDSVLNESKGNYHAIDSTQVLINNIKQTLMSIERKSVSRSIVYSNMDLKPTVCTDLSPLQNSPLAFIL